MLLTAESVFARSVRLSFQAAGCHQARAPTVEAPISKPPLSYKAPGARLLNTYFDSRGERYFEH